MTSIWVIWAARYLALLVLLILGRMIHGLACAPCGENRQDTRPCLCLWCQTIVCVQHCYQWVVSFLGRVDDDFTSYLGVLLPPQATPAATTSLLSFRLISMCVSWDCHLHTEMYLGFHTGHLVPKGFWWGGNMLCFLMAAQVQREHLIQMEEYTL